MYFKETRMRRTYSRRKIAQDWRDNPEVQKAAQILKKMAPGFRRGLRCFDNLFDPRYYKVIFTGAWELDYDVWEHLNELWKEAGLPPADVAGSGGSYEFEYKPSSSIRIDDYDDITSLDSFRFKELLEDFIEKFKDAYHCFLSSIPSEAALDGFYPLIEVDIKMPQTLDKTTAIGVVRQCTYKDFDILGEWIRIFW